MCSSDLRKEKGQRTKGRSEKEDEGGVRDREERVGLGGRVDE